MQASEVRTRSKDVQLLLWAAGEARARARRPAPVPPVRQGRDAVSLPNGLEFFTEWQPVHH